MVQRQRRDLWITPAGVSLRNCAGLVARRGYDHNDRLGAYCLGEQVPLVEIASKLRDEHFADELHPNEEGAQVIAQEVFRVLNGVR
jgi:lysophospholipase L1-like esterase